MGEGNYENRSIEEVEFSGKWDTALAQMEQLKARVEAIMSKPLEEGRRYVEEEKILHILEIWKAQMELFTSSVKSGNEMVGTDTTRKRLLETFEHYGPLLEKYLETMEAYQDGAENGDEMEEAKQPLQQLFKNHPLDKDVTEFLPSRL